MSITKKIMEYKGFNARIMEAERLTGDSVHNLPPGNPLNVYPSDVFVEYPEQWMKGPGVFVVPVRANKGLWFDWTMNSSANTAVLPTVKGCNPITGLQTSGFHLERYSEKCPKHNVKFEGDRYCPKCGYVWPAQNYIYGPPLWWDGFRSEDGSVRQFFFTEDDIRDVATHMIGKENTVPAFGFAFYQPKEMRAEHYTDDRWTSSSIKYNTYVDTGITYNTNDKYEHVMFPSSFPGFVLGSDASKTNIIGSSLNHVYNCSVSNSGTLNSLYNTSQVNSSSIRSKSATRSRKKVIWGNMDTDRERSVNVKENKKEVSIGAGAKINQSLNLDPYALDTWRNEPSASMVIYFVFQDKLDQMLSKGVKDLKGKKEGMLDGIPVG